ncbi:MAG: NAD(+) diphosphatase [Propionibacteriaceae bacterium]|nr:NAD(+) diphosphatase [Propionibacteriaceae bacterium]
MTTWESPSQLDRVEDRRSDDAWVAQLWASPQARVLAVSADGRLAWADGGLDLRPVSGTRDERHLLAGLVGAVPVFIETGAELAEAPVLRAVMDGLDDADLQVAFTAAALADWHRRSGFCGECGAATVATRAGAGRRCAECAVEHYPRVDPAVIVAVTDADDRLLLGRQPVWVKGRVSVFAGFVEAGESLEQAVHREVFEEVGVRLRTPRYFGSQPWPFPRSMMLGFTAEAVGISLTVDTSEIEEARWFTRAELDAGLASGAVGLPMRTSIAHRLITAWRNRELSAGR